jgi:hypothetical protein
MICPKSGGVICVKIDGAADVPGPTILKGPGVRHDRGLFLGAVSQLALMTQSNARGARGLPIGATATRVPT